MLLLTLLVLLIIAAVVVMNTPALRLRWFTQPLFNRLQKIMPPMSETERIALDAGDTWWEADLFRGNPDWKKLMATQFPPLSSEEQAFIDNQVETLCGMLDDFKIVHEDHDLPQVVWEYLKKEKFFGMIIPKEYGGLGFSALAHSTVVIKLGTRSISAAVDAMVPNSLGPAELLLRYGTEEQKNYYLPRLATGQEIPCFGLTGPTAGSDAAAIPDTGVICKGMHEGKEIIGLRLNFDKRYITLAPIATVVGLAFKVTDPDHLLSEKTNVGITLALIPAKHPGIDIGRRHLPMGLSFMNGPIIGKDVFIPLDWIIGGVAQIGDGWRMLMECLSTGRSISLPALSGASAHLTYRMTGAYAYIRKQFKLPVGDFEGVQEALANIAGFAYLVEATRRCTAAAVDCDKKPSVASAIAKYHLTELNRKLVDAAMDVHAGRGIQWGPRNYLGLGSLGVPIGITVEGANILTRNLIIFGQGAIRCHPYIQAEMQALASSNLDEFDKLLMQHLRYSLRNFGATFAMGFGAARFFAKDMTGPIAYYYQQLTRMSAALAFTADITMLMLGGALKRRERLSARLGDVLSYLYLATSVLKYYNDNNQTPEDLLHVDWTVEYCLKKIQHAFDEFFTNFPQRWLGWCLRFIVFPFGRVYKAPRDVLSQQLATTMLKPSAFRDRLTQYCYVGKNSDDPTGRIENTFNKLYAVAAIEKKIQNAVRNDLLKKQSKVDRKVAQALKANIITSEEAKALLDAEAARWDAIQVDDFAKI